MLANEKRSSLLQPEPWQMEQKSFITLVPGNRHFLISGEIFRMSGSAVSFVIDKETMFLWPVANIIKLFTDVNYSLLQPFVFITDVKSFIPLKPVAYPIKLLMDVIYEIS
jgi:hypothetical protein